VFNYSVIPLSSSIITHPFLLLMLFIGYPLVIQILYLNIMFLVIIMHLFEC